MPITIMEKMLKKDVLKINQEDTIFENGTKLYYRGGDKWTLVGSKESDIQESIINILKFKNEISNEEI